MHPKTNVKEFHSRYRVEKLLSRFVSGHAYVVSDMARMKSVYSPAALCEVFDDSQKVVPLMQRILLWKGNNSGVHRSGWVLGM